MYTQCPDCATSFRVTAEVLKQAAGKVRCGGCGNAFNALEYLSESKPASSTPPEPDKALPELRPDPFGDAPEEEPPPAAISPEQSAALLKTLDQLAGEDIRLEDTGIEWRLMAEDEEDEEQGVDEVLDASPTPVDQFLTKTPNEVEASEVFDEPEAVASDIEIIGEPAETGGNELRFDDNTGLPEDFDFAAAAKAEPVAAAPVEPPPEPVTEDSHPQVDLALGDPDEWGELLSEAVIEPETAAGDGPSIIEELEALVDDVDAPAVHEEAEARVEAADDGDQPLDIDTQFDLQAEALGLDLSGAPATEEAGADDVVAAKADEEPAPAHEPDPTETSIDDDLIAAAFEAEKEAAAALEMSGIELALDEDEPSIIDDLGVLDDDKEEQPSIADELDALEDDDLSPFDDDDEPSIADELIGRDAVHAVDSTDEQDDIPDSTGALEFELATAAAEAEKAEAAEAAQQQIDEKQIDEQQNEEAEIDSSEADFDVGMLEADAEKEASAEPESSEADDIEAELALLDDEDEDDKALATLDDDSAMSEDLAEAVEAAEHVVPPQSEEEQTINAQIDQDLLRLAIEDDEGFASTIVFEKHASSRKRAEPKAEVAAEAHEVDELEGISEPDENDKALAIPEGDAVETIIMEGSFARTAEEQERIEASTDEETGKPAFLAAAEAEKARGSGGSLGRRIGMFAGVTVLLLGLGGQFVHQSRAELATIPVVNDAIAPIYRALGMPITPAWDVSGWRFEVTRGSTGDFADEVDEVIEGGGEIESLDDEVAVTDESAVANEEPEMLTIYSRIGNQSSQPLPYPLVSVSLTDRFEETIGNVVLEPAEYLTGDFDPRRLVPAGETFDAVISIESPSMEATGFKLNVCYRQTGGLLRCAIEDFK